VGLPSSLDSLTRWLVHRPLWSLADRRNEHAGLVDEVARLALRIARRCREGSPRVRERWGYDHLHAAYRQWHNSTARDVRARALAHETFAGLVELAQRPARAA
jgi:hypothetical protein